MAAVEEAGGWCYRCYGQVPLRRAGSDHLLHLRLSAAIVACWPLLLLPRRPWRCSVCGSTRVTPHRRTILRLMHEKRHGRAGHEVEWT